MHIFTRPHQGTIADEGAGPQHIAHITAGILDRLADAELQHGHHARAEYLAQLAAEMRAPA